MGLRDFRVQTAIPSLWVYEWGRGPNRASGRTEWLTADSLSFEFEVEGRALALWRTGSRKQLGTRSHDLSCYPRSSHYIYYPPPPTPTPTHTPRAGSVGGFVGGFCLRIPRGGTGLVIVVICVQMRMRTYRMAETLSGS